MLRLYARRHFLWDDHKTSLLEMIPCRPSQMLGEHFLIRIKLLNFTTGQFLWRMLTEIFDISLNKYFINIIMWKYEILLSVKYTMFSLKSACLAGSHHPPLTIMGIAVCYFSRNCLETLQVIFLARPFWLSAIPRWQMGQFGGSANQISTEGGRLHADTGNLHLIIVLEARNNSKDKINVKRQKFWAQNLILKNYFTVVALGSWFWRNWQSWLRNKIMILQLSVPFQMPAFYHRHNATFLYSSAPNLLSFDNTRSLGMKDDNNCKTQQSWFCLDLLALIEEINNCGIMWSQTHWWSTDAANGELAGLYYNSFFPWENVPTQYQNCKI